MKTATAYARNYRSRQSIPFPNAASRRYMLHRLLDGLLMAASGAGIGAALLLMLVL